jgi:hypothetical protein
VGQLFTGWTVVHAVAGRCSCCCWLDHWSFIADRTGLYALTVGTYSSCCVGRICCLLLLLGLFPAVAGGRCSCYCYWGCYLDVEYGTVVHAVTDRTVVQAVAGGPVAHGLAGKSAVHAFAAGIVVVQLFMVGQLLMLF